MTLVTNTIQLLLIKPLQTFYIYIFLKNKFIKYEIFIHAVTNNINIYTI